MSMIETDREPEEYPEGDACPDCGARLRWGPWCGCGFGAELDLDRVAEPEESYQIGNED